MTPGDVFIALPGSQQDGRDFIAAALASGAVAVLSSPMSKAIRAMPVSSRFPI